MHQEIGGEAMRVYVDLAFVLNAAVDYLLLVCSAKLSGAPIQRRRILLAAILGGMFAAATFFCPFLQYWPMRFVIAAGMILLSFGARRSSVRQGGVFLLVSLALAGLVLLVAAVLDWGMVLLYGAVYYPVSWQALLCIAALGYLAAEFVLRRCAMHGGGEIREVKIETQRGAVTLPVLRDTGNTLRDPVNNTPVLVVEWQAVRELLPPEAVQPADPVACFAHVAVQAPQLHWRLLPYRAVGVKGVLLAFQAQRITLGRHVFPRMTVALSPTPVADGGGYLGLLGGME